MISRIGFTALFILAASCQGPEPAERGADFLPKEAWDGPNAPRMFGNLQSMPYQELARDERLWGVLEQQPWSDDYWPWMRAGLAYRWLLPQQTIDIDVDAPDYEQEVQQEIAAFLGFARQADPATRQRLSAIEKYDMLGTAGFPLTTKELQRHANFKKYYEDNDIPWAWMGSCDGWALASLHLPAPRQPVLASAPGREPVLFTVGDIRGLVSKMYTDNDKSQPAQMLGTRCNRPPDDIARDANHRIVDGTLGRWQGDTLVDGRHIRIVYNNWRLIGHQELPTDANIIVFRHDDGTDELYWLQAVQWTDAANEIVRVEVRPLRDGQIDPSVPAETMDFRYLKSCRDMNAGAFHIVLARLLSTAAAAENGQARGFAIEVSRADEVWNQPIYAYQTRVGAPLDLAALDPGGPQDAYGPYRAPGTRYLVHAYTTVYYGMENGPLVIYGETDERLSYTTYQYTLELDEERYVIGGEWHRAVGQTAEQLTPRSGTALLSLLADERAHGNGGESPDFLWRYLPGTRSLDTCNAPPCLSTSVIDQLVDCSRETPLAGDTVNVGGQTIPFVRCSL